MEWLARNPGVVITAVGFILSLVATWVKFGQKIEQNQKTIVELKENLTALTQALALHEADKRSHLDHDRDKAIWDAFQAEMLRRLDGIERKVERLMIIIPPPSVV